MTLPSVVRLRTYRDFPAPAPHPLPFRIASLDWKAPPGKVFVAVVVGSEAEDGSDPLPLIDMLRALVIDGVAVVPDTAEVQS